MTKRLTCAVSNTRHNAYVPSLHREGHIALGYADNRDNSLVPVAKALSCLAPLLLAAYRARMHYRTSCSASATLRTANASATGRAHRRGSALAGTPPACQYAGRHVACHSTTLGAPSRRCDTTAVAVTCSGVQVAEEERGEAWAASGRRACIVVRAGALDDPDKRNVHLHHYPRRSGRLRALGVRAAARGPDPAALRVYWYVLFGNLVGAGSTGL